MRTIKQRLVDAITLEYYTNKWFPKTPYRWQYKFLLKKGTAILHPDVEKRFIKACNKHGVIAKKIKMLDKNE